METGRCKMIAAAAFGLEGLVSSELKALGMADITNENSGIIFTGSLEDAYLCNLSLRFSDRVYILMAEDFCRSFEELFQLVLSVPWEKWMTGTEKINISARCVKSQLMSPSDCQSVSKKALIERLKKKSNRRLFPETGESFPVHVAVHQDQVRILLDTSGSSLSRRGYRTWNGEAPLRESLAAALVRMSPWKPGQPLYDPCCGTGTIVIEAALRNAEIAPGLRRHFAMESLPCFPEKSAKKIRQEAEDRARLNDPFPLIGGSDIDPAAVELAQRHCRQAGLSGKIHFEVKPLQELTLTEKEGVFVCNPPYGERIGDRKSCHRLYRDLHALMDRHPGWALCALSSDPEFEKAFGKRASKKRRLYNGRLECNFFIYLRH